MFTQLAISPAFDASMPDYDLAKNELNLSTWTRSLGGEASLRIFLISSPTYQWMVFLFGVMSSTGSLFLSYVIFYDAGTLFGNPYAKFVGGFVKQLVK